MYVGRRHARLRPNTRGNGAAPARACRSGATVIGRALRNPRRSLALLLGLCALSCASTWTPVAGPKFQELTNTQGAGNPFQSLFVGRGQEIQSGALGDLVRATLETLLRRQSALTRVSHFFKRGASSPSSSCANAPP